MLARNLIMPVVVAGAIGMPILLSSSKPEPNPQAFGQTNWAISQDANPFTGSQQRLPGPGQVSAGVHGNGTWILPGNEFGPDMSAAPLEFLPINDLGQIIRLDMSVADIRSRFPRISLVSDELGRQGYRTELVTGTGTNDLHGCITWYFDSEQKVQRMSFRGWTGDHRKLKEFLAQQFLMSEKKSSDWTEMMTLESWNKISCIAIFQLPSVVRQKDAQQQIAALIEINRSSSQQISPSIRDAARF